MLKLKKIICLVICLVLVGGVFSGCKPKQVTEYNGIEIKVALDDSIASDTNIQKIVDKIQIQVKKDVKENIKDFSSIDCLLINNGKYDLSRISYHTVYLDDNGKEIKASDSPTFGMYSFLDLEKKVQQEHTILLGSKKDEIKTIVLTIDEFQYN